MATLVCYLGACGEDKPDNTDSGACETDNDCQAGFRCNDGVCVEKPPCTDLDRDGFCDENEDCAICTDCNDNRPDINPDVAEDICDHMDNDCDDLTDEDCPCQTGEQRPCGQSVGACSKGVMLCTNGVWGECTGNIDPEESENCQDSLDNDCNGAINDGCPCQDGETRACGSNLGDCTPGIQNCIQESGDWVWSECVGGTPPIDESCDDEVDNDCDGAINNGCMCETEQWRYCGVNTGICHAGIQHCYHGIWGNCEGGHWPELEVCDDLDNDCDGTTDPGCECVNNMLEECGTNIGECKTGTRRCVSGEWTDCQNEIGPTNEVCDGKDNDCDTERDEDFTDLLNPCQVGTGQCTRPGVMVCRSDATGTICSATPGQGSPEICDERDNDCDTFTDEDYPELGQACTIGTGICESSGIWTCRNAGSPNPGPDAVCNATVISPQPEVCDGLDNNCNGDYDENFQMLGVACTVGIGECLASGVHVCTADGSDTECDAVPLTGSDEECDGLDNDCDGLTDEGPNNDPQEPWQRDCQTECGNGIILCRGGQETECSARQPQPESCNYFDDDCDGSTDEDFLPPLGDLYEFCSVGQGMCYSEGYMVCNPSGTGTVCNAVAGTPQEESGDTTCPEGNCSCHDHVDNDCDGATDCADTQCICK